MDQAAASRWKYESSIKTVKLLGTTLDQRLSFKEHLKQTEAKALRAIGQIWRLGVCYRGRSMQAVLQLYQPLNTEPRLEVPGV
ncbi:hypothetical protein TRICI_006013 [Trichomonascus ciferrii]|uniref:Uncharacterized protein n=1 Tax=Trichomonascus ciferrii TaxID=44093 RepID=A0A642UM68_9ASCO|nr:hypothetical protein TRICI_006013 [Trichomonascus ciferrii]